MNETDLKKFIRNIPDFPQPGIMFRDITPLLADSKAFQTVIDQFAEQYRDRGVTAIAAAEARGFIFAAPLALALGVRFIPVRKPGKLPFETRAFHYELEYGSDSLEIHTDAIHENDTVLLVDDLLATAGTMQACVNLVEHSRAKLAGCAFLIELEFLGGRAKLSPHEVFSLIRYADES
jgi:adenine phosphoribosyltransferase